MFAPCMKALCAAAYSAYAAWILLLVFVWNVLRSVLGQAPATIGHPKKVCIIGSGASGLVCIKEMLAEGHEVSCFEKNSDVGGIWNFEESEIGVYSSTLSTSSVQLTSFSDFPVADDAPYKDQFHLGHRDYLDYMRRYTKEHELKKYISFRTEVVELKQTGDKWAVTTDSNGAHATNVFDAVAICSGIHQKALYPDFPGQERFQGIIDHSSQYCDAKKYKGKNVVIIGCGESGADIVKEISDVTDECHLSLRRGIWVIPRIIRGYPNDYYTTRALYSLPFWIRGQLGAWFWYFWHVFGISTWLLGRATPEAKVMEKLAKSSGGRLFNQFSTKSDFFIPNIVNGKCLLKPGIKTFTENGVTFTDGETVKADVIMYCTGYVPSFPFFPKAHQDLRNLYKNIYHPDYPNLAFIGMARPGLGAIPPIAEMQSRWYSLVVSGVRELPTGEAMQKLINADKDLHKTRLSLVSDRLNYLVDFTGYMNDMAVKVGCVPSFARLALNPYLFWKVYFGPFTGHQFRLDGPHPNRQAAIHVLKELPVVGSWPHWLMFAGVILCNLLAYIPVVGALFKPRLTLG